MADANDERFLADTGATTHIVKENTCLYKKRRANLCGMKVGTGAVTRVTEKGDLNLQDMNGVVFTLHKVHVVPAITRNIISISQLLREGWQLGGTREVLTMTKDGDTIIFERDNVSELYFVRVKRMEGPVVTGEVNEMTNTESRDQEAGGTVESKSVSFKLDPKVDKSSKNESNNYGSMNINEAHRKWGHPSYAKMKSMAEVARIKLHGEEEQCDACGVSKVKCNPIPKATETHATQPGERIFY